MVSTEPLTQLPVKAADYTVPADGLDAEFQTRWTAWLERGRLHELRARRTFVAWATALSVGASVIAIIYALFRP